MKQFKPILIPTDSSLIYSFGKELKYTKSIPSQTQLDLQCYSIILIDTEAEIVDLYHDAFTNKIYDAGGADYEKSDQVNVIISSTDKSLVAPFGGQAIFDEPKILSPQSTQLLINYYNEFKELPEFVNVEHVTNGNWEASEYGRICVNCECEQMLDEKYECECGFKIKLNQQGEVDIAIPEVGEKLYTEEEVGLLCLSSYKLGLSRPRVMVNEWTKLPDEWFDSKKK